MSAWRREGIAPPTLVVNLSLAQLRTGSELVEAVTSTLARWGLSPEVLELDVTEAMLAHPATSSTDALERLRERGVRIAIDDFGTQSSSLASLRAYGVSRLTVPRTILDAAQHDERDAATLRAIVAIARELELEIIAQGIETQAQRDFLAATAPSARGQGFLFSPPVPAARATELLRAPASGGRPRTDAVEALSAPAH
jgi:EAL domain-containing protein (putative c-di-GMP-specific phosphodiesterase class I)